MARRHAMLAIVFALGPNGLELVAPSTEATEKDAESKSTNRMAAAAVGSVLAAFAATVFVRRRAARSATDQPGTTGLDRVRDSINSARGQDVVPQQPVGFGLR